MRTRYYRIGRQDMTHVLVVDDEPQILRTVTLALTARGYRVTTAADGAGALRCVSDDAPDLVVLDLGLPDIDGMDIIRRIRLTHQTPIIVLSARAGGIEKVTALDLGADDYVTKPFDMTELLARVRAAGRRSTGPAVPETVRLGPFQIDLTAKTAERSDGPAASRRVLLTPTEWQLLEILLRHPGRLLTGRQLLTELRGDPLHTDSSYLRIYISQLRRKLEQDPARPRHLITEPGLGYRFQP